MPSYILSLNCGSSSFKFKLYDESSDLKVVAYGQASNIGSEGASLNIIDNGKEQSHDLDGKSTHEMVLEEILNKLSVNSNQINVIAHRIVHGGEHTKPLIITNDHQDGLQDMDKLSELAPLHNHHAILTVRCCLKHLSKAKNVLFFDTLFHLTLPAHITTYPITYTTKPPVPLRRYGFHGISYAYITDVVAQHLSKSTDKTSLIICHLGSGASVTAVQNGNSIDNSMGLTPLEGLLGGTRSGSLDPSLVFHAYKDAQETVEISDGISITRAELECNKNGGLKAIAGTSDFGEIIERMDSKQGKDRDNAHLAFDLFCDRILSYIGSYWVKLGGKVDAVVFSGGIGEKGWQLRQEIARKLTFLGVEALVESRNQGSKKGSTPVVTISDESSNTKKCKVLIAYTDEEYQMAKDANQFL